MIEEMKRKLEDKLYSLSLDIAGRNDIDATYIAERLMAHLDNNLDFFNFAENWITSAKIKGIKNYCSMLNSLKSYIGKRELPFDCINYRFLKDYEDYLSNKPRAQSLYLGQIRHLFREAMKTYNTDSDTYLFSLLQYLPFSPLCACSHLSHTLLMPFLSNSQSYSNATLVSLCHNRFAQYRSSCGCSHLLQVSTSRTMCRMPL